MAKRRRGGGRDASDAARKVRSKISLPFITIQGVMTNSSIQAARRYYLMEPARKTRRLSCMKSATTKYSTNQSVL
jgi:hypothetical protein